MNEKCRVCPRGCVCDRTSERAADYGICGVPQTFVIGRIGPHMWEEPPVSGKNGSGAVFFSGCNLGCVFCQNRVISRERAGERMTEEELGERILALQESGVNNINLVTATHYADSIAHLLERIRPKLHIPVVYNCGGYEGMEALRRLAGLVDVYLPDFKYVSGELSAAYSKAPDYAEVASRAIEEMYRQVGAVRFSQDGTIKRGMIVRHLVLPGCRKDSIEVLRRLETLVPVGDIRLSLMSQYTPDFAADAPYPNLHRRLTSFEYSTVLEEAQRLGFDGYSQELSSATKQYTPEF